MMIFESPNYMPVRLESLGTTINMTLPFVMVIGLWISIINVILPWIFCVESDPYVIHRFLYSFNYGASMALFLNFSLKLDFGTQ